jgi:hypothetical protein
MPTTRREFLMNASRVTAGAALSVAPAEAGTGRRVLPNPDTAYRYRIAFGAWINDMRLRPLPLEQWPAPHLDDETVESATRALDLQARSGFQMLDAWGLFATYGWPPDIVSALDRDRRRRIQRLLRAAKERGMRLSLGLGVYSWGYDRIIEADPSVRGKNPDGTPHAHAMCDASPKSFEYVKRIVDFTLGEFDFGGVHMESCDLGCCFCPECAGKDGVVGYNTRINAKVADYIKARWPEKVVYSITINWVPPFKHFDAEEKRRVLELGRHVDCVFDQGHSGYHVAEEERRDFVGQLACAYGTSGRLWLYPDQRWERDTWFLPYPRRSAEALKQQFADGVRGCLFYQGPVTNPGVELTVAVGGRILADTARDVSAATAEALEELYRPKTPDALKRLAALFERAEESYFRQWKADLFRRVWGIPVPGEFKLDQNLFGTSPGPATFLREPCLDAEGRKAYRDGLHAALRDIDALEGRCRDGGRLERIRSGIIVTLNLINTIRYVLGES